MLKQQRRLFPVAAYKINNLPDHDDEIANVLAFVRLWWFPIQAVSKFPNGREVALLGFLSQFLRDAPKPKRIAPERNPKRIVERFFSVQTSDRPSHDALRIRFAIDMSLLLIHHWNYDCKGTVGPTSNDKSPQPDHLPRAILVRP